MGHINGNAKRCKGRCPITCLSANCHVRLLACPILVDRQVIGQFHGHHIAVTLPWPLLSHCRSIAITRPCHCRRNHSVAKPVPRRPGPKGCKSAAVLLSIPARRARSIQSHRLPSQLPLLPSQSLAIAIAITCNPLTPFPTGIAPASPAARPRKLARLLSVCNVR